MQFFERCKIDLVGGIYRASVIESIVLDWWSIKTNWDWGEHEIRWTEVNERLVCFHSHTGEIELQNKTIDSQGCSTRGHERMWLSIGNFLVMDDVKKHRLFGYFYPSRHK